MIKIYLNWRLFHLRKIMMISCVVFSIGVIVIVGNRMVALAELERSGAILQSPNCRDAPSVNRLWGSYFVRRLLTASLPIHGVTLLQASGSELIYLRSFPELKQLCLHGGRFDNDSLSVLHTLVNLEEFAILGGNHIDDTGLAHLQNCRRLRYVVIDASTCDGTFLEALECTESLTHLEVTSSSRFGDYGLLQLERFSQLCEVDVSRCYGFNGSGFVVFDRLDNVKKLTTWIPDESARLHLLKIREVDIEKW